MYQFSYDEILDDAPSTARARERQALDHAVELLRAAEAAGPSSRETVEALSLLRRLWTVFIDDLASARNELPDALKADLISIGLFVLGEAERIRSGKSSDIHGLIEISHSISEGLA